MMIMTKNNGSDDNMTISKMIKTINVIAIKVRTIANKI